MIGELKLMRIAIISDIHGNLTALDVVLADLRQQKPDRLVRRLRILVSAKYGRQQRGQNQQRDS